MKTGIFLFLIALMFVSCNSIEPAYYIDSVAGSDNNDGLSPQNAWQTLEKASSFNYRAGDQILLSGNQTFTGIITLKSVSGNPVSPIVISSFGDGRAIISSSDSVAVLAKNCNNLVVKNLVCKGSGRLNGNNASGVDFRECQNIILDSIDVSGYLLSGVNTTGGSNIRITNVYAHDNGFCGIHVTSDQSGRDESSDKSVQNVYIGYSLVDNNPGCPAIKNNHSGNGILVGGVTNALIEYCEAMNNGWDMPREGNGPVGIWAYMSDSLVIQHCYAHHNKTSPNGKDGGGFDFDGGMTNSIMQYNLSAFNEGAGYGIFQYIDAGKWENNIVRNNISYYDGSKNGKAGIHIWCDVNATATMAKVDMYNNTIVNRELYGVNFEPGDYKGFLFENNIFYLTKNIENFVGGKFTSVSFKNNVYWSPYMAEQNLKQPIFKADTAAIIADPLLDLPLNDSLFLKDVHQLKTLDYFKIKSNSPCIGSGKKLANRGNFDFFGNVLLPGDKSNIGAYTLFHTYAMPGDKILDIAEKVLYKKTPQEDLYLYLLRPDGKKDKPLPAIVYFTGGGWWIGNVSDQIPNAAWFAENGLIAITADYRVGSRHNTTPLECIKDAKSAIRYIREHAKELGIDPNRIIAAGGSAGGHLAVCTFLDGGDEPGEDLTISTKPNALVLHNPALGEGFGEWFFKENPHFSPIMNVKAGFPPTILSCGTKDELTPFSTARKFTTNMKKAGNTCVLIPVKDAFHSCDWPVSNPNFLPTLTTMMHFLEKTGLVE